MRATQLSKGAIVGGSPFEVGAAVIIQVTHDFDRRESVSETLGRDVPNNRSIASGISLGGHEKLTLGIDRCRAEPRPNRLLPRDDGVIGAEARLSQDRDRVCTR